MTELYISVSLTMSKIGRYHMPYNVHPSWKKTTFNLLGIQSMIKLARHPPMFMKVANSSRADCIYCMVSATGVALMGI